MKTFRHSLNVIMKSKMSKMRMNINVKEFLRDTFYNNYYNRMQRHATQTYSLDSVRPLLNQDLPITNLTELSKHAWCLKEAGLKFKITWKILKQTSPYNPVSNQYNLCH